MRSDRTAPYRKYVTRGALRIALATLVLALSLVYGGHFAGDAEIHLVFAKSASLGKFFEFNPGEPMTGVTSVGYMLVLGALNLAVPDWAMPVAAKLVGYASWFGLVGAAHGLARELLGDKRALVILAVVGLMPGSAYNSLVGMENGMFGLIVLLLLLFVRRHAWLERPGGAGVESRAALILGLLPWLRPEGFVVAGVALMLRWVKQRRETSVVLWAAPALLLGLGSLLFHHHFTGRWLPGSAVTRLLAGTMSVGGVPLNSRVVERLAFYLPMTFGAVLGTREVLRSKEAIWQLIAVLTWLSLGLHSTVFGGPHVGRYLIYVMPLLALLAARGIPWPPGERWARASVLLGGLWLGVAFAGETVLRFRLGSPHELEGAIHRIQNRAQESDDLAGQLGISGRRPTRLAYVEAQARLFLDDRFVIRSLDGRVDTDWLRFVHGRTVDYAGYLRHREIDYLMDLPGDPSASTWTPARLRDLASGETRVEQGLAFTRPAGSHFVRVQIAEPPALSR